MSAKEKGKKSKEIYFKKRVEEKKKQPKIGVDLIRGAGRRMVGEERRRGWRGLGAG